MPTRSRNTDLVLKFLRACITQIVFGFGAAVALTYLTFMGLLLADGIVLTGSEPAITRTFLWGTLLGRGGGVVFAVIAATLIFAVVYNLGQFVRRFRFLRQNPGYVVHFG